MSTTYHVRIVCETETGDGKGFHYHREDQVDTLDPSIDCPDHPNAVVRDFVVESEEAT